MSKLRTYRFHEVLHDPVIHAIEKTFSLDNEIGQDLPQYGFPVAAEMRQDMESVRRASFYISEEINEQQKDVGLRL